MRIECLEGRELLVGTYLDAIGWIDLRAELGASMPTGAGVPVAQIEHREQSSGGYAPNLADTDFVGKSLVNESGDPTNSLHATRVGEHFYGYSSGVAPGVTDVDIWEVSDWESKVLHTGESIPPTAQPGKIQNHSWNGAGGLDDLEVLRRFDYLLDRDNVFAAVSVGNEGVMNIPRLLSSSYNAMTVGLSGGTSNYGLTKFDGVGRVKPDIVAPEGHTSQAAPQVAGAAALLINAAARSPWSSESKQAAQDSVTLKASLLAGATTGQLPSWSRTPLLPIDQRYGAGQLNVYNSLELFIAGKQGPGEIALQGWDRAQSSGAGLKRSYYFTVPAGVTVGEMPIALTWNRTITSGIAGGFANLQSSLANLDLTVEHVDGTATPVDESRTTSGNVEFVRLLNLTPGRYQISVVADRPDVAYALAWDAHATATNTSLETSLQQSNYGQRITLTASATATDGSAPVGSIAFFDDDTLLGAQRLTTIDGTVRASFTIDALTAGSHSLRAVYVGQGDFATSESAVVDVTIDQSDTTTTLSCSPSVATSGESISLTAAVAAVPPGAGAPTGTVTFYDGDSVLGSSAVVMVAQQAQATLNSSTLSAGNHVLTARYEGDANFNDSVSIAQHVTITGATVVDRRLFYNQSRFDGDDAAAGTADDAALATDKTALLPGQTPSFANYTSYNRGLNGIMVDIANLPTGALSAIDFAFNVGNSSIASSWATLSVVPIVSVRPGAGMAGSSRITLTWPTGAAIRQWLQVTVKANVNTGLATPDVFYFGNAVGESGNVPNDFSVSITDELLARNNPVSVNPGAAVTNRFDYNRDGTVSVVDQLLSRNNLTTVTTKLQQITAPGLQSKSVLSAQRLHDSYSEIARALAIASIVEQSSVTVSAGTESEADIQRPQLWKQPTNPTCAEAEKFPRKRRVAAAAGPIESDRLELLATGR